MGTSSPLPKIRNGKPLLPTWLDEPVVPVPLDSAPRESSDEIAPAPDPPVGDPDGNLGSNVGAAPDNSNEPREDGSPGDFKPSEFPPTSSFTRGRTNFTKFTHSGGKDQR